MGRRNVITQRADLVAELAMEGEVGMAALHLAGFAYPGLDVDGLLGAMIAMASEVRERTHLGLRRVISISHGIGGNVDDYYDPDNSFLNRVIETRKGIPVTLAILWMEVGRRAGIDVQGVALPGHFLVYAGGQLVDPFHYGETTGADEAASLVSASLGGKPRLEPAWLDPVPPSGVVVRLLRNLDRIYRRTEDPQNLQWVAACLDSLGARA